MVDCRREESMLGSDMGWYFGEDTKMVCQCLGVSGDYKWYLQAYFLCVFSLWSG